MNINYQLKWLLLITNHLEWLDNGKNLFYNERYSHSLIPGQPDFVKLAEAYGIKGYQINSSEEADTSFK